MRVRYLLLVLLGVCLSACQSQSLQTVQQQFFVFGTVVEIRIAATPVATANAAIAHIAEDFQRLHRLWHAWEAGPVADLNQALASGRAFQIEDADLLNLLRQSQLLSVQSGGLFNPALGRLSALWGFHHHEFPVIGPPPSPDAIAALVAQQASMADVHIAPDGTVSSDNPTVQFDFGAIAKGYAVDLAVAYLRQHGIDHAIVNAGGNLRAIGRHGERPWRIGIRHPNARSVLASVTIDEDESVFTSGNYERYREYDGMRYSHILDPRSGWPVKNTVAVTVIAPNGTLGDAASTALSVAGLEAWRVLAQTWGLTQIMLVDAANTVYVTPELAARIKFETPVEVKILTE
jgi:FAD:protein FMN transferase